MSTSRSRLDGESVHGAAHGLKVSLRRGGRNHARWGQDQAAPVCLGHHLLDLFLDGPSASVRDAVHVVFAGEKVRPDYELPAPNLDEAERLPGGLIVLSCDALIRMKLTSFRRKDQVHLLDLIGVGLVNPDAVKDLPPVLSSRLRELLEDPEG